MLVLNNCLRIDSHVLKIPLLAVADVNATLKNNFTLKSKEW